MPNLAGFLPERIGGQVSPRRGFALRGRDNDPFTTPPDLVCGRPSNQSDREGAAPRSPTTATRGGL